MTLSSEHIIHTWDDVNDFDVVVLTAKILENGLNDKKLTLRTFGLLVVNVIEK